jgi:hypothetical protein
LINHEFYENNTPKSKDFQNKMHVGVYTCGYVLLSLILKVYDKLLINRANSEINYILILMMHNIIFDIFVSLWNFINVNCID